MDIEESSSLVDDGNETPRLVPSIVDIWYCDSCKKETRNDVIFDEIHDVQTDQMYQLCRCANCEKPFFFVFQRPKPDKDVKQEKSIPYMAGRFSSVIYQPS